ncbi:hypothetical protein C0J52_27342 [Blattella germanica]|nr:hypothetical protein C0J52_27342 [Blattella germanica]
MWISAAAVIITILVVLEPVEEVDAGHSRLVIHTPQRIKTIHHYHTSEHYAKNYGYREWHYKPKKKPRRSKYRSHKPRGRRGRYRKRYLRKISRRTPFTGGKSYGMYNYAKNYRNWRPSRSRQRPWRRHRDSYFPSPSSEESKYTSEEDSYQPDSDYNEDEYSSNESNSFDNDIQEIDYHAQRNRNYNNPANGVNDWNKGTEHNNNYNSDHYKSGSHVQGYSTLPDEFINPPVPSDQHDYHSDYKSSNQDYSFGGRKEPEFSNSYKHSSEPVRGIHTSNVRQGNRFSNENIDSGLRTRYNRNNSPVKQEHGFDNQNFNRGHESRYNIHDDSTKQKTNFQNDHGDRFNNQYHDEPYNSGHETRLNSQKFRNGHEPGFQSQKGGAQHDSRFNVQNFGTGHDSRFNTPNSGNGHDSRLKTPNFGTGHGSRLNSQNFENGHESRLNTPNFATGHGSKFNTPNSETGHETRYSTQNFGTGHEFGFTTHISHTNSGTRFNDQGFDSHINSGEQFNEQHSDTPHHFTFDKGTVLNNNDPEFGSSRDSSLANRPERGSSHGIETQISITSARPQSADTFHNPFRASSVRKSPIQPDIDGTQFHTSANVGRTGQSRTPSQGSTGHSSRERNQWFSHGVNPNKEHDIGFRVNTHKEHDIGFLEGLEDINDGGGI